MQNYSTDEFECHTDMIMRQLTDHVTQLRVFIRDMPASLMPLEHGLDQEDIGVMRSKGAGSRSMVSFMRELNEEQRMAVAVWDSLDKRV